MSSFKFSPSGLLRLRPFDESAEDDAVDETLRRKPLCLVLNIGALLCIWLGVATGWAGRLNDSARLILVGLALSAVAAGIAWNVGLHARAMNQLFMTLVFTSLWALT